ncbi:MAG: hypothetical protein ACTSXL_01580 [Alphaproteobacteria bacterium]|nr:MAG: hypothetical protein B6I23_01705 [Rickettsiaceae bacterium 4572_127]
MKFKNILISASAILALTACDKMKNLSFNSLKSTSLTRTSGDGKTPKTAIVVNPTLLYKTANTTPLTVEDNIRYFYAKLNSLNTYSFEAVGTGYPNMYLYKLSQCKTDNSCYGEPLASTTTKTRDQFTFSPTSSDEYIVKIILYSGSKWTGGLKHKIIK